MKTNRLLSCSTTLLVLVAFASGVCIASDAEPILHWAFELGSGTRIPEVMSGEANVAAMIGAVDWVEGLAPYSFYALRFVDDDPASSIDAGTLTVDGAYVAGSHPDFVVLDRNYTITAWIQLEATENVSDRTVVSSDWDAGNGWLLFVQDHEGLPNNFGFDFGSNRVYTGLALPIDTPLFVALQADESGALWGGNNKHRFSVWDGAGWQSVEGESFAPIRLQGIEIGSFSDGDRQFEGAIDDLRIYNVTLSQEDLDRLSGAALSASPESD